jgi:hypothetical protein
MLMLRAFMGTCLLTGCVVSLSAPCNAQEIIHALTGTVASIETESKTITVLQDNGTQSGFQLKTDPKTHIAFDKRIEAESTAAGAFDKQGAYVIVFYYGGGETRTAVALKSLGAGPFSSTEGIVTKFDSHAHTISVQDSSGAAQVFRIDPQTVAEGTFGAVPGDHFHADKGDHVRVVSVGSATGPTAVFLRDL